MKPSNWHFARRETFATKAILDAFDNVVTGMSDETDSTTHDIAAGMTFFAQFVARKALNLVVIPLRRVGYLRHFTSSPPYCRLNFQERLTVLDMGRCNRNTT